MTSRARKEERSDIPSAQHLNQAWQEARSSGDRITFGSLSARAKEIAGIPESEPETSTARPSARNTRRGTRR